MEAKPRKLNAPLLWELFFCIGKALHSHPCDINTLSVDEKKTKISFTFRIWAGQINSVYYFRVVALADSMLSFIITRLSFSSLLWLLFLEKKLLSDKAL